MPYIFNKYHPARTIVFIIGEGLLIFMSLFLVNCLSKGSSVPLIEILQCMQQALVVTITFQVCLYLFDLYDLRNNWSLVETAVRITQAFGVGCVILSAIYYFLPLMIISTRVFWSGYFIIYILVLAWRSIYRYILKYQLFLQSIVIVGTGNLATDIVKELEDRYDVPYRTLAFIGQEPPGYNPGAVQVIDDIAVLDELVEAKKIDRIIVALDDRRGNTPVDLLLNFKLRGVVIEQGVTFYERLTGKVLAEKVEPSWIIYSDGFAKGRVKAFFKRSFDLIISLSLLALSLPIMFLSAIIIKLETPGPIFYSQERVGMGRRKFSVLKFRSMVQDAETNGAVWATANDARVTRFGQFIRKTRIDELPQLINVIRGEMSMVGPRPERKVFVEQLKKVIPYYDIRHEVRPGITGWAQVCYPYGASEEDALRKLEYDLYYMKHISLPLDVLVIFRTIKTVLFAKGGR